MKKPSNKQAKKASKLAKAENLKKRANKVITVKNAEGDPDTTAEIVIQNKINYEPKVSVIIPVYNVEQYLRECLDSVVNQTLKEIEIICVDDGSTDSSLEILKEYAKKDNRITVMKQENLHAGVARNAGLAVAKGEYLSFLDSDDWFELNMLEEMSKKADMDGSDIVVCNYDFYDNKTGEFKKSTTYKNNYINISPFSPMDVKEYLFFISVPNAWTKLFRKKLIKKENIFFENFKSCNDITFVNTALSLSNKISITNSYYIHYRINSGINISTNREQKCLSIIFSMKKLQQNLQKNDIYSHYKKIFETQLLVRAKSEVLKANFELKKEFLKKFSQNFEKELYDKLELSLAPKVSIIIPIYNAELYLKECLNSVVNQTLREIEIICVNDASTDNSLKILEEYAKKDGRIKIINNEKNSGAPGFVKNIGIEQATGKYIGFVDSDDWIDNNYFEELYKIAIHHNADISATTKIYHFKNNKTYTNNIDIKDKILETTKEKSELMKRSGSNWNKIYRRMFIVKNNITCYELRNVAEDNYFSMISMVLANKIAITSNCTYYYRKNEASLTAHKRTENDFYIFNIYQDIDNFISKYYKKDEKLKKAYLDAINRRKIQDFKWFSQSVIPNCLDKFKHKLKTTFPEIYWKVIPSDVIVSLTSYPGRINTVNQTIESILNQSMKADKVILWLAPEQFPNREKDLPKQLLDLCDKGLTIDWYHDIKSYKKLIPTLKKYPDAIIVTADDDLIYNKNWLKLLYDEYIKNPDVLCAHRTHCIKLKNKKIDKYKNWKWLGYTEAPSYSNFITGGGGVLYPPNSLHKDVLKEDVFIKLCPNADDVWFWAMSVLNNIKIKVAEKHIKRLNIIEGTQDCALSKENVINNKNDEQLAKVLKAYPEVMKKLIKEHKKQRKAEEKNKPSLLKSYLLLPFYLLKIQQMKRVLGKSKPSRVFSVNRYGNKKVYRILGFKFAFNNIKKDVIDNQEKIIKMLNDLTIRQKKLEQECKELRAQLKR